MIEKYHLSFREEELMDMLWSIGRPMITGEMISVKWDRSWKDSYLNVMIRSLLKKELIRVAGIKQNANIYARQFEPTLTREEYTAKMISSKIKGRQIPGVMLALAKEEDIDAELIEKLESIIKEMEEN